MTIASDLIARGFTPVPVREGRRITSWSARCDSCAPCVVNGVAIHERGCPNDRHECAGCNTLIPARSRYCGDCQ